MADGSTSKSCLRLCGLVAGPLRRLAASLVPPGQSDEPTKEEAAPLALSKETEKDLLISLTLVCREINRWTTEVDCDCEQANVVDPVFHTDCLWHLKPPFECQNCLASIISLLMAFLASNSQHVRHMACKVLVAISNFLMHYVGKWEDFIRLLWISLQVAIVPCVSLSTSAESASLNVLHGSHNKDEASSIADVSDYDASFVDLVRSGLKNANWLLLAGIIEILHIIGKSLKNEGGESAESYLHIAVLSLLKVPWDPLSKIFSTETSGLCITPAMVGGKVCSMESNGVFLGAMLRLFCSLAEHNNFDAVDTPLDDISIYVRFNSLVSKLLVCCFSNCNRYSSCMYQFLRHKALVLMIRLSFWPHWRCSSLVLWLELLQKYFKDLLHQPISRCHAGHDISIEGSPFLASVPDGEKTENICTTHLQRQTTFLFLKCCYGLICSGNQTCHECTCGLVTSSTCASQEEIFHFNGLFELYDWLQRHFPLKNYGNDVNYLKLCSRFSLYFLQLYMDEDDLLFEMLLQLLDSPFPTMEGQNNKYGNPCEEMGKDISFHISNIFNPIHLFHLFLSLIHYDHLVLLDYLISKDTGIHFVQYLLRCLRLVCKSWSAFVEFSVCPTETGQPHSKRRKLFTNGQDSSETLKLASSSIHDINDFRAYETGDSTMDNFGRRQESSARPPQTFQDAKECLLSLKTSMEDLHRKNLFPYSPTALLRSFTRFQELCKGEDQG